MISATRPRTETISEVNETLGALIDELTDRLQAGEAVDLETCVRHHPEHESQIRGLFPALQMMAALGRSAVRGASSPPPPGGDPRLDSGVLGDYRIVREVGRGGMGIVFEAVQVSLGRRVALKILPLAAAVDPRHLQRFQLEAQAAAHLHHPHIVPIFAVGCDRGVHYYAMQFIDGRSLADLVADLRQGSGEPLAADFELLLSGGRPPGPGTASADSTADADPTASADPEVGSSRPEASGTSGSRGAEAAGAVARLGVQAAEALEHAHGLGVLHRDIKPANLLVQADGHLWVADFGLARFGADTDLTRTGDILGTLRYMSPEQAMARRVVVDHRTDIYSLGATLYELLAARPAFDGQDRQELLRKIAQDEPTPPRQLDPTIPRDLETIVLKAMAKEPEGRYSTALELADDLRRFLADEPIRARRPGPAERLAKWSKRHRAALASAAIVLVLAMIVGSSLLLYQVRQTERAYNQNRKILDLVFSRQEALIVQAMGVISLANSKGLGEKDAYIGKVLDFYQDMINQAGWDPDMAELKARSYHRLGFCRMVLRDVRGAEADYRQAIALFDDVIARSPGQPTLNWLLAATLSDRGMLLRFIGNRAQSEADYRRAIALRQDAAFRFTPDAEGLAMLAWSQLEWAGYLEDDGRAAEAEATRRQLAEFYQKLEPRLPRNPGNRQAYAMAHITTGANWFPSPHARNAEVMFNLAKGLDPDDPAMLNGIAWFKANRENPPKDDLASALDLVQQAIAKDPNEGDLHNTLGVVRYRLGDWKGAIEALEQSVRLRQGGDPFDWYFLAMAHHRLGDRDAARRWFEKTVGWNQESSTNYEELKRFRSEAEALLELPRIQPKQAGPPG